MQSMASQSILISKLFTCDQPFSAPYPPIFPKLLLPGSSRFPFNTFGSFPKHSTISLAQFPNALPLIPYCFPYLSCHPTLSKRCSSTDSPWWVSPLDTEAFLGQPWEGSTQGLLSSESIIWVPACLWALLGLWRWAHGGLMAPGMGLGVAGAGYFLGFPHLPLHLCAPLWVQMIFFILQPNSYSKEERLDLFSISS